MIADLGRVARSMFKASLLLNWKGTPIFNAQTYSLRLSLLETIKCSLPINITWSNTILLKNFKYTYMSKTFWASSTENQSYFWL